MKLFTKVSLLACLFVLSYSCSVDSIDNDEELSIDNMVVPEAKEIETKILDLVNDYRLSKGLNTLSSLLVVKSQAFSHTDYMVDTKKISHDNFFSRSKFLKENAGAKKVSENVAYGFTSAESVVNAWIKSDGHRINLEGDYTDFDISAEKDVDGKWYYTIMFIEKGK